MTTNTVAVYVRVSTEDQSIDRQLSATTEYAEREFGIDKVDIRYFRDHSTGTNTNRTGYRELMKAVETGELDTVVVHEVTRISRSNQDLERTATRMADHGVALHIVSEGLVLDPNEDDPFQKALFQLLGVFAELEANMIQQRVREGIAARQADAEYHHGRAPLGFRNDGGQLVENERYQDVTVVLEMVEKGELSKRKAATRLDTSRKSIDRALERPDLYGL